MTHWRYPTAFHHAGVGEQDAIDRVVRRGRFTMGEEVEAFEAELAAYHGVKHAVMVNSGSSANLVAVAALFHVADAPLRRNDRVIVPALAWPTLYAPLVQHGLRLSLLDIDETWNAAQDRPMTASDAALIVVCPVLGNPPDMGFWVERARAGKCHMIEDACESLGAAWKGKMVGTFGRMGTLSFFYSHQLSAIEGGAILTNDDECATLCHMLRNHGWTRGTSRAGRGFASEYDFHLMGYNLRPLELHAAIGREQLKRLDQFQKARCENYLYWLDRSGHLPIGHPNGREHGRLSPFGIPFTVADAKTRERAAFALRMRGIDCRPPAGGSFRRHPYSKFADFTGDTPLADALHDTGLFIGNAPYAIHDLIDEAINTLETCL